MIQAKDLRIGNYVNLHTKAIVGGRNITTIDKDIMVGEILLSGINHAICKDYIRDKVLYPFDNLSGILLTPELLKKCGFVILGNSLYLNTGSFEIQYYGIVLFLNIEGQLLPLPHINFMHQLQNLYYILTKEELIVNL